MATRGSATGAVCVEAIVVIEIAMLGAWEDMEGASCGLIDMWWRHG